MEDGPFAAAPFDVIEQGSAEICGVLFLKKSLLVGKKRPF